MGMKRNEYINKFKEYSHLDLKLGIYVIVCFILCHYLAFRNIPAPCSLSDSLPLLCFCREVKCPPWITCALCLTRNLAFFMALVLSLCYAK